MLATALVPFAGCRDTDVLTLHVEDQEYGVPDPSLEPLYQEVAGAPQDPTRISSLEAETPENLADQEAVLPDFDEDAQTPSEDDAAQRAHSPQSDAALDASQGTRPGQDSEGSGAGNGQGEDNSGASQEDDSADEEPQASAPGNGEADADSPGGESNQGGQGLGGTGQVYDDGTYQDLPEEVGSIAATGPYALIVQMLAGEGGLAAADAEWLDAMLASGAFPGEGLEDVARTWTSSQAGGLNVQAVVDSGADVVLTEGTDAALNEAERAQLSQAGVDVVVMPAIGAVDTPDDAIAKAVQIVGELLRDAPTQYDASAMAQAYLDQHAAALADCKQANGGYSYKVIGGMPRAAIYQGTADAGTPTSELSENRMTTVFIDGWASTNTGNIVAQRSFGFNRLYLDGLGVDTSDGAGISAKATSSNFALLDYYLQVSGVVNNAYDTWKPSSIAGTASYAYPIVAGGAEGVYADGTKLASRTVPSALWFAPTGYSMADKWSLVGDADFPGVITRSASMADSLAASAAKVNGLYNVGQPYQAYVMPEGLAGSWADGTPESFLAAPWAFATFWQNGDLTTATTYVDAFYETFYRVPAGTASSLIKGYGDSRMALCPTS